MKRGRKEDAIHIFIFIRAAGISRGAHARFAPRVRQTRALHHLHACVASNIVFLSRGIRRDSHGLRHRPRNSGVRVVIRFWERFHSIRLQQPSAPPSHGSTLQPPTRVAHAPLISPPSPLPPTSSANACRPRLCGCQSCVGFPPNRIRISFCATTSLIS